MENEPPILEYQRGPWRRQGVVLRYLTTFRRDSPARAFLLLFGFSALARIFLGDGRHGRGPAYFPSNFMEFFEVLKYCLMNLDPTNTVAGYATLAAIASALVLCWMIFRRLWREVLLCLSTVLAMTVLCGLVQLYSCPHCTYLQVYGFWEFLLAGEPCGNGTDTRIWYFQMLDP